MPINLASPFTLTAWVLLCLTGANFRSSITNVNVPSSSIHDNNESPGGAYDHSRRLSETNHDTSKIPTLTVPTADDPATTTAPAPKTAGDKSKFFIHDNSETENKKKKKRFRRKLLVKKVSRKKDSYYSDRFHPQWDYTTPMLSSAKNDNTTDTSPIPRRLIFTYPKNLLYKTTPKHLHSNVMGSIKLYADAWGIDKITNMDVLFYNDKDCINLIKQLEPRFVKIFWTENYGAYRGDMCRIAALYQYGGYYLDVDIQPLQALDPPPGVDFITARMDNGHFFQAIMAVTPRHPILKATLESMLNDWYMIPSVLREFNQSEAEADFESTLIWTKSHKEEYTKKRIEHLIGLGLGHDPDREALMGPVTLRIAYDRQKNVTTPWFLDEIENSNEKLYPELIRKEGDEQLRGCNYLVHDAENKAAYFYSRCRGTWLCPRPKFK